MSDVRVIQGDMLEVLPRLHAEGVRFDGCFADPPYHLGSIVARLSSEHAAPIRSKETGVYSRQSKGFMGQKWDAGDIAFRVETWRAVFDVLKPGAHLMAFSGTKKYHRLVCAIEDAGFEIRDMIPWLYGTGFPKSHDIALYFEREICSKGGDDIWRYSDGEPMATQPPFRSAMATEWFGWETALKPAIEPLVLARKPMIGAVHDNVRLFGTGGLHIDATRIPIENEQFDGGGQSRNGVRPATHQEGYRRPWMDNPAAVAAHQARLQAALEHAREHGRWPANFCHDGSAEVLAAFAPYGSRGAQSPVTHRNADMFGSIYNRFSGGPVVTSKFHGDEGGAERFFYSSKATQGERIFECSRCGSHTLGKPGCGHDDELRTHPTVKPIDLVRWYLRMIIPAGGLVLDPFAGTGTTGAGARLEGFNSLLIEKDGDHCRDIALRMGMPLAELETTVVAARPIDTSDAGPLFGSAA